MQLPRPCIRAPLGALLVLAAAVALERPAGAQTACSSLPSPIVVAGSTAIGPVIRAMGTVLAGQASPVTLIYQSQGSCTGVNAIVNDVTPTGACTSGVCITGNATYYDATGAAQTCTLDAGGQHVDVGVSDVFANTCPGVTRPATVGDFLGPVQAMTFVVPSASTQRAITFEEAYFVFGFGTNGQAQPWTNESLFFIRNQSSGTQQIIANAIGVPAARMRGVDSGGSSGVLNRVTASTDPERTIGILSAEFYDQNRSSLKALAFRGRRQRYAYFPDSTATSFDKINVRQGRYLPFGYLHLVAAIDSTTNVPVRAGAAQFIDWVLGNAQNPPFDAIDLQIQARTIPQCAMSVQRSAEGASLTAYQAPEPCGCYFEFKATGATSCTACTSDATCGGGKCRRGYCEAR
ncbi:MAG TPA: hypothetical protein VH877_28120 [Polyangia bacterium]|nr:hypothetical protein [Polyangia bacterium]